MAQFLFNLPDDLLARLRECSRRTGAPMAHFAREALDHYLHGELACPYTSGNVVSGLGHSFHVAGE